MTQLKTTGLCLGLGLCAGCFSGAGDDAAMGESSGFATESDGDGGDGGNGSGNGSGNEDGDGSDSSDGGDTDGPPTPGDTDDPFDGLPTGKDQWDHVCAQNWQDPISLAFCAGGAPPPLGSLADLQLLIGLDFVPGNLQYAQGGNPAWAWVGHSTSISTRLTSPLNPRSIVFTPDLPNGGPNPDFVIMAFVRGEGFVELISKDPVANELRFFLVKFTHGCEVQAGGCSVGDRFTPSWESGWLTDEYTLYDGDTIRNTIFDCKQCHQINGPGTTQILRMHEFQGDWDHWFYPETPGNLDFVAQYRAAKGIAETYGGVPAPPQWGGTTPGTQSQSRPANLDQFIGNNGFDPQPALYETFQILCELGVIPSGQNECNGIGVLGYSPTWDALYDRAVTGQIPPVPIAGGDVTDPAKLATATAAYQDYLAGLIAQDDVPDMSDVIDPSIYPDMSIRPKPGLNGREIMVHMCQHCHNSRLDQGISRANFNVETLDNLGAAIKNEAVRRLLLPDTSAQKMPPTRFHELSDAERDLVIAELGG